MVWAHLQKIYTKFQLISSTFRCSRSVCKIHFLCVFICFCGSFCFYSSPDQTCSFSLGFCGVNKNKTLLRYNDVVFLWFRLISLVSRHVEVCLGRISTRRIRIWGQTLPISSTRAEKIEKQLSGTYLSGSVFACFSASRGRIWTRLGGNRSDRSPGPL